MIIKNRRELDFTSLRKTVLDLIEAGIARVGPSEILKSALRYDVLRQILTIDQDRYDVSNGRIFVIGGGKAAALMAQALESVIPPENIIAGVVNCKKCDAKTLKIKLIEAGHPLPDERGLTGVEQMLALKNQQAITENDLVICLISGGGSSLMPCPVEGVSLADKQELTQLLLGCGASIPEINAVRKHLSKIKGGGLGRYFAPARVVSLILSDVIGNDMDVIASGLTCPDESTFSSAIEVLNKYDLWSKTPENIRGYLQRGCNDISLETPKNLANCRNYLIGDNLLALRAMANEAKKRGFNPYIITAEQKGETTEAARQRASEILHNQYAGYDCLLAGGETTPKLPEKAGQGGRNQHYAAVSMLALKNYPGGWTMASVGTDGSDYLPEVAGAIVDADTLNAGERWNIQSYLDRYDSYNLLNKCGSSLIVTGSTGTNVGDIIVYAFKPE